MSLPKHCDGPLGLMVVCSCSISPGLNGLGMSGTSIPQSELYVLYVCYMYEYLHFPSQWRRPLEAATSQMQILIASCSELVTAL